MRLTELFLLLELRDRVAATAETFQKKLIQRFKTADEEGKLRGGGTAAIKKIVDSEPENAAKQMVEYFAGYDPSKNNKYLDWIVRQFIKGNLMWEDASRMRGLLTEFEKFRKVLDKKDLNQYKHYRELEEALEPHLGKEVAGVRVKNFVKKGETQGHMNDMVPDPDGKSTAHDFRLLYDEDHVEDEDNIPQWFEDSLHSEAEDGFSEYDGYDYEEMAKEHVDPDNYSEWDEDEEEFVVDEDAFNAAVERYADELAARKREEDIEEYVENEKLERWKEYVESNRNEIEARMHREAKFNGDLRPALDPYYQNDRMSVFVPNTEEASCYIGKGTKWCTSAEDDDNYFWQYRLDGPIYTIVTDKLGKYQFHFESPDFKDQRDRDLESSSAVKDLKRLYSKELKEAFGEQAQKHNQLWLLDAEDITPEQWQRHLELAQNPRSATSEEFGGVFMRHEEIARTIARLYHAHADKAPPGWAEAVKEALTRGDDSGQHAHNERWFGELNPDEISDYIVHNIRNINSLEYAKELDEKGIAHLVSEEAWQTLVADATQAIAFMPDQYITRELVDKAIQADAEHIASREPMTHYYRTSFIRKVHNFRQHLEKARVMPRHEEEAERYIPKLNALASHITKDDIIFDVLNFPDNLEEYEIDYGMEPWDALYNKAEQAHQGGDDRAFVKIASMIQHILAQPKALDSVKRALEPYLHKILHQDPTYHYHARNVKKRLPPETQLRIVDYIGELGDEWERRRWIQDLSRNVEAIVDPATLEVIKYLADLPGSGKAKDHPKWPNVLKTMELVTG